MDRFKIGDRVGFKPGKYSLSVINMIKEEFPDLTGFIIKINNDNLSACIAKNEDSIIGYWVLFENIRLISPEPAPDPPEPPQEEIFIPSCSSCFNRHHSAMDKTKPCYGCYGGDNSNFVCMGEDTTQS